MRNDRKTLEEIEETCHEADENKIGDGRAMFRIMMIMKKWRSDIIISHIVKVKK